MLCAIRRYLAGDGQQVREAETVVAGYAACGPHFDLAEIVGKAEDFGALGLSALDGVAAGNCGQCGRFLGSELCVYPVEPGDRPLCVTCAPG